MSETNEITDLVASNLSSGIVKIESVKKIPTVKIPTNKTITNYIIETEKPLLVSGKQLQQLAKENNFEILLILNKNPLLVVLIKNHCIAIFSYEYHRIKQQSILIF